MKYKCMSGLLGQHKVIVCAAALAMAVMAVIVSTGARAQDIRVTVDGELVQFQDLGPQQVNGRTLVPVRGVLEKLGANVSYNSATRGVVASTPTIDIQLTIGSTIAIVNANNVTLDVPAQTINDHTFVPLRFLGEALGAEINWDPATRTVIIKTKRGERRHDDSDRGHREHLPPPPEGPAPVINSFAQTSSRWLRSGAAVETVLEGTPGGQAMFRIPGIVEDVPMRETAPGHYVGSWQVPIDKPIRLKSAAVIGSLNIGTRTAPLIQAGETVSIDTIPPIIRDTAPEDQANVNDPRPTISAAFQDDGSGIERGKVRLNINGQDVTGNATVTRDFITYRPDSPLQAGVQQIELSVANAAGNRTQAHWAFNEQSRVADGIKSVSDNADHALQPGDTIRAELQATPGGRAWISSGSIHNVPMREDQPGHYVAEYTIRKGDDVADRPIAFHLVTPDGQKFEQVSRHLLRIATGKPSPPQVISPGAGEAPTNPLVISGRSSRNARVQIRVDYKNRVLGVFALQGTAAEVIVPTDGNGNWQTGPINLGRVLSNKGVEYTITATAINGVGEFSEPTIVTIRVQ